MSQPATAETILEAFFQERRPRTNLGNFVDQAEAAGQHQLAKIIRAVIASDGYRDKLMHHFLPIHSQHTIDYYVCPHCGLIYELEAPEQCVADETPGAQFEHIG